MEAFDFAFGPMKEYDLDASRTLTLKGKAFHVFSFRQWKSQLRLIEGCYSGQKNEVSELLKVGAPDEISPLFTFRTVGVPHHPRVSSWPGGSCSFRSSCGPAEGCYFGVLEIAQKVGTFRKWEHDCVLSVHYSVIFFVPRKCDLWNASSAKSPDGRSVWRHATPDGERGRLGLGCSSGDAV